MWATITLGLAANRAEAGPDPVAEVVSELIGTVPRMS